MDLLAGQLDGAGGKSSKDAELAKAMFEGTQAYRRKLKLPEMNDEAQKIKDAVRLLAPRLRRALHSAFADAPGSPLPRTPPTQHRSTLHLGVRCLRLAAWEPATGYAQRQPSDYPVSYTHLTLPTICSV